MILQKLTPTYLIEKTFLGLKNLKILWPKVKKLLQI